MNCWMYKGECLETPPEGYYGFVYKITDDAGFVYFGKKAFTHKKKTKLSKRAISLSDNKRKKIKVEQKDSGWLSYWGSSKPFLEYIRENGTEKFTREILYFCKSKQDLTYWELHTLVTENVLFRENCWNGNVMARFFKGKISNYEELSFQNRT